MIYNTPKVLWSSKYGTYVTRAFLEDQGVEKVDGSYKIDPTQCILVWNVYGYPDLVFKGRKVKRLTVEEALELRKIVKEVIHE